jgi:hypothetical protein
VYVAGVLTPAAVPFSRLAVSDGDPSITGAL